ncbi:MAG: phytoene desaturase family protein [Chlorobi bacterium]|nr:phytoene desaturase family protein [Chlorobiota bacterium]
MKKRMIVVGAGLGGLSLALRAASDDWNVTLLERSSSPGGKMNLFAADGFRFDTGPSLITLPHVFTDLLDRCGVSRQHLVFRRLQPLTQYRFADGERIEYPGPLPSIAAMLERYEADGGKGYWKLMATAADLFELSTRTFFQSVPTELPEPNQIFSLVRSLHWLPLRNAWGNYAATVERHLSSPYLRQIFERYPTYVGSSPYRSPATLLVIPYLEFAHGGWYVEGGLYGIVETIVGALRERGVRILTNATVEKIVHSSGRVRGVRLSGGDMFDADVVVFNGDATTADALLDLPRRRRFYQRSMSGVVFLLGLRRRLPPDVFHHTIAFSSDYRREFEQLFERAEFPTEPTVYLNVTSKTDPTVAPPGGETLFVMANAPAVESRRWEDAIPMIWERIAGVLERRGIAIAESDIVVRSVWTPERFERDYAMPGGSIYGWASHSYRTAFLRPPMRDRCVRGLYYVGGSTHPGGGTPMVVLSSKLVYELIERYERSA